ncbi:Zn-ribbon domain-containing protein [Candidatus Woesearchaeota archaeon]|nr:Zn-ribbon domain-containing protein [Candidatus Woesearchaeota archaeon]
MPHQCVRCNAFYEDGASEILKGCKCGGKLFFYIRKEKLEEAKNMTSNLSEEESKEIEKDVMDLVGERKEGDDTPVVLDLESIRVLKPGKYELDLVHLFKGDPVVFKTGDGKYMIDIVETFKRAGEKEK